MFLFSVQLNIRSISVGSGAVGIKVAHPVGVVTAIMYAINPLYVCLYDYLYSHDYELVLNKLSVS